MASNLFQNLYTKSTRLIYTPSLFAKESLIYLQEVGKLTSLKPHISKRDNLSSYLFIIVTDGKGTLNYQGIEYQIEKGDCVFIDCHNGYSQHTSNHKDSHNKYDELWSLEWLHFNGPTMTSIYDKYLERGGKPVFKSPLFNQYLEIINSTISITSSNSYVRDMLINEKLSSLLSLLMQDAWTDNQEKKAVKKQTVKQVKEYIDNNYQEKLSLDLLSSSFYINKQYLLRIFKEEYGYTVGDYIVKTKISAAKELLRFSDKSIDEISSLIGIDDANYFARLFKKIEGISPSMYRKSW